MLLNQGNKNRIAGRDYHEKVQVISVTGLYLATESSTALDEKAIDNERLFKHRFGIDASLRARQQVIALKRAHGLTDSECRWLWRSRLLKITREGAKLVPDRLIPIAGWLYAITLSAFFCDCLWIINLSHEPSWKQSLGSAVALMLWLGAIWGLNRLFWEPWRWTKIMEL